MDLKILVFFVLFVCSDVCLSKSLSVIQVPHNAKPGFIITVLSPSNHISSITDSKRVLPTDLLSIQDTGVLTVSKDISHLKSHLLTIHVWPANEKESLQVLVSKDDHAFGQAPYHGVIETDKIMGLEAFSEAVYAHHLHNVHIIKGRQDIFEIKFNHIEMKTSISETDEPIFKLLIGATESISGNKVYAYVVLKVNSRQLPRFSQSTYHFVLSKADVSTKPVAFVTVEYFKDDIQFGIPENDVFYVNKNSGEIFVKSEEKLKVKSYEIPLFMEEKTGVRLAVTKVHIEVFDPEMEILEMDNHLRKKRATLEQRNFVVRSDQRGDLFSVSRNENERYTFKAPAPVEYLVSTMGMISVKPGASPVVKNFVLNRTMVNDPNGK